MNWQSSSETERKPGWENVILKLVRFRTHFLLVLKVDFRFTDLLPSSPIHLSIRHSHFIHSYFIFFVTSIDFFFHTSSGLLFFTFYFVARLHLTSFPLEILCTVAILSCPSSFLGGLFSFSLTLSMNVSVRVSVGRGRGICHTEILQFHFTVKFNLTLNCF